MLKTFKKISLYTFCAFVVLSVYNYFIKINSFDFNINEENYSGLKVVSIEVIPLNKFGFKTFLLLDKIHYELIEGESFVKVVEFKNQKLILISKNPNVNGMVSILFVSSIQKIKTKVDIIISNNNSA